MREKRKTPRYDIPSRNAWSLDARIVNHTDRGVIATTHLPLVRDRVYRLDVVHSSDSAEPFSRRATVVWSRQTSAEPSYQIGFNWAEPSDPEKEELSTSARELRIGPSGGGVAGRIPWQTDAVRLSPPDRAFIAREISLSGMLMETADPDPPSDLFPVEIPAGPTPFRCLGRIVRTTAPKNLPDSCLHGVEFLDVLDDDLSRLRDLLDGL